MHSTFSDGLYTPSELCDFADKLGLTHVALCDHDTVDGLAEMSRAAEDIRQKRAARSDATPFTFLPSVEISTGSGGRTHLLGYGVNTAHAVLTNCLKEACTDRLGRAKKIIDLLAEQEIVLSADHQLALTAPTIGRAQIARVLVQEGVVKTMGQAFDRYLGEGKCAYVPRKCPSSLDAIEIIKSAGGVAVLAHPMRLALDDTAIRALIDEMARHGLDGLEVFHPSASRTAVRTLNLYARNKGLLVTGGSDFHGDQNTRVRMGRLPSGWQTMSEDIRMLLSMMSHS